jgi:hypothetical protein
VFCFTIKAWKTYQALQKVCEHEEVLYSKHPSTRNALITNQIHLVHCNAVTAVVAGTGMAKSLVFAMIAFALRNFEALYLNPPNGEQFVMSSGNSILSVFSSLSQELSLTSLAFRMRVLHPSNQQVQLRLSLSELHCLLLFP